MIGGRTTSTWPDQKEPDRLLRQCPHCHQIDDDWAFKRNGPLECPYCGERIIERKEGEDG